MYRVLSVMHWAGAIRFVDPLVLFSRFEIRINLW